MTQPLGQTPVDPLKMIAVLKGRLADEIGRTAMLEAMLQDAQQREQNLGLQISKMIEERGQAEETPDS